MVAPSTTGTRPRRESLFEEVLPVREASRGVVRELGFLQDTYDEAGVSHSEAHAMMEIARGMGVTQSDLKHELRLDKSTMSRLIGGLVERGWVKVARDGDDARRRTLSLTPTGARRLGVIHGPANARVQSALATLSASERRTVLAGLRLYFRALRATRVLEDVQVRPIRPEDDAPLADIIDRALAEFGAGGPGFVNADPEFKHLHRAYQRPRCAYFVATLDGSVIGGAGVAPLKNAPADICEFQKMYLTREARGLGLGQRLLEMSISTARALGFRRVYLETLSNMKAARALYEKNGFRPLKKPVGGTGHFGCDAWYVRTL